jgi:HSP20 family protein
MEDIMAIVRWTDPFREFAQLQDRLSRGQSAPGAWVPPVDIYQSGQAVVLKAELPDMTREDIDITVDNGTLTIKGEKKLSGDITEDRVHRIERRYGAFSRSFSLPRTVDTGKVAAEYKNGVLTVRLPLREDAKPRQIKVDIAA